MLSKVAWVSSKILSFLHFFLLKVLEFTSSEMMKFCIPGWMVFLTCLAGASLFRSAAVIDIFLPTAIVSSPLKGSWATSSQDNDFAGAVKQERSEGRFILFPFTMYGPNVQLMGLKQMVAICQQLDIKCAQPGFSDLFAKNFYDLGDFFDYGDLLVPRSTLPAKLRPDVFLYGVMNAQGRTGTEPRWPTSKYFEMHGIDYHPSPDSNDTEAQYARTREYASKIEINVESALKTIEEEVDKFRSRPESEHGQDYVVAMVYSSHLGNAKILPPDPLQKHYLGASKSLLPSPGLQKEAGIIRDKLFPANAKFISMHLRLIDHCKTSIEECCCETSGDMNRITPLDIEVYAEAQMLKHGTRNLFISAPPSFQSMVTKWDWFSRNKETVKLWYSSEHPGSLKESMLQQIICSRAASFVLSVPSSTWSDSVKYWMDRGSDVTQLQAHAALGDVSKFSMGAITGESTGVNDADTRTNLIYAPAKMIKIDQRESEYAFDLKLRLEQLSYRTTCDRNTTLFAMLRNDGLGASFHFVHLGLGIALSHGIPLYTMNINPGGSWAWGSMCESNDWSCMFQPTNACSFSAEDIKEIQSQWTNAENPCPAPWCLSWSRHRNNFDMKGPLSIGVPDKGFPSVLYRSILTDFLFRLSPSIQADVDARPFRAIPSLTNPSDVARNVTLKELRTRLDVRKESDPPIIAMHIRQGDSCKDPRKIRKCFKLEDYMKGAIEMRRLYGSDTILAATDSEEIVANMSHYADWNWLIQDISRTKYDVKDEQEYKSGGHIPAKMTRGHEGSRDIPVESITDLSLLSLGSIFIGTFTSDFSRLAYELACARTVRMFQYMPPYVSLAGTYCAGDDPITKRAVYSCD